MFFGENLDLPADSYYNVNRVILTYTPVVMKYGGLPIEPIADGRAAQTVLWAEETRTPRIGCFIKCLKELP
ncbi:MAG: hypothetical protein J6C33_08145 [Lachnospiraceae bacterium]|nr:hypothetical protein [Lachnospiraceae bacterium]